jgi:hypothetical protein
MEHPQSEIERLEEQLNQIAEEISAEHPELPAVRKPAAPAMPLRRDGTPAFKIAPGTMQTGIDDGRMVRIRELAAHRGQVEQEHKLAKRRRALSTVQLVPSHAMPKKRPGRPLNYDAAIDARATEMRDIERKTWPAISRDMITEHKVHLSPGGWRTRVKRAKRSQ